MKILLVVNDAPYGTEKAYNALRMGITLLTDQENIVFISKLPYNEDFTKAMTIGKTIVEYENEELKNIVTDSWNKVKQILEEIEEEIKCK